MTCDDCRRDIAFYAAGQLPPAEASALEEHILQCEACRLELEEERAFSRDVHNASVPFRQATQRIGERLSDERRPARVPGGLLRGWAAMTAYLAVCTAAALLILFRAPDRGVERVVSWGVEHYALVDQTHPLRGDAGAVRAWFKEHHGIDVVPPADADYSTLTGCKMTEIDGEPAPLLRFDEKGTSAVFMLPPAYRSTAGPTGEPIRTGGYVIRIWSEGKNAYMQIARGQSVI